MIEDCEFESNYVGLLVTNAGNNVNIVNSVLVDNEVGLYLSGGMQQNIEGCVFEGNGGPAIVLFYTRATTINSNYFEGNNARPLSPRGPSVCLRPVPSASDTRSLRSGRRGCDERASFRDDCRSLW